MNRLERLLIHFKEWDEQKIQYFFKRELFKMKIRIFIKKIKMNLKKIIEKINFENRSYKNFYKHTKCFVLTVGNVRLEYRKENNKMRKKLSFTHFKINNKIIIKY